MENTPGMNSRIRVGILLDSYDIPNWSYIMLQEILESSYAEIVLIVKNDSKVKRKKFSQELLNKRKKLIYRTYRKVDRKLFKCNPDAFERKNIHNLLSVPCIEVKPRETKYSDWIKENDLQKIKDFDIDIFIRMGFRILKGGILKAAKYGIWSYHHGDNAVNRGGPPGFWEVMNNEDETGVVLQILTNDLDGGLNLFKSFSLTDHISVNRNTNNYYWKALSFLPSKLEELSRLGDDEFFKKVQKENQVLHFYDKPLYKDPGNIEMAGLFFNKMIVFLREKSKNILRYDQWILLYKISKGGGPSNAFYQFKKIMPPKDRIWADPFVIFKNDRYYIFIEELFYSTNKGHISVIEMDSKGNYGEPKIVLEKPYHLSYPNIFENNGELFMIPETKENGDIELYKCVDFPNNWKFVTNLMENVHAVDTTLHYSDGLFWMFTNIRRNKGASTHDELFLYYSKDLDSGNWKSHPENPVISDVSRARPAGKIFEHKGILYRPSQNCSRHYGYGLNLNKIEVLDTENYREIRIDASYPDWENNLKGVHTFNFDNNLTVIDAIYRRHRLWQKRK